MCLGNGWRAKGVLASWESGDRGENIIGHEFGDYCGVGVVELVVPRRL